MNAKKIKKAETELKKIARMKKDLQNYVDCSLKSTLLKSCELCELVWTQELKRLRQSEPVKPKKSRAEKQLEDLSSTELEEIAFDIHTPDDMAKMALTQLIAAA